VGLLLLTTALACPHPAGADDTPLPEGTALFTGIPPYHAADVSTPAAVRAWCDRCADQGREERGTRRGGDLLLAAADGRRSQSSSDPLVRKLYETALEAYPRDDVTRAITLVRWAQHESVRGNAPERKRLLERLDAWLDVREPRDADEAELQRWQTWDHLRRVAVARLRAEEDEAQGRLAEAAAGRERLATEEAESLSRAVRVQFLERAARLYYRAGKRQDAVRTMRRAAESVQKETPEDTERARAQLLFWTLHAKHGLLTPGGAPRVDARWPAEGFAEDLDSYLRGIQGIDGLATTYLALASRAYAAKKFTRSLDIYLLALRDPSIVAQARHDSSIWGGLLMGYSAAMELERFDDAERILGIVERVADEPIAEKDAYLVALSKARQEAAQRPLREAARRKWEAAKARRAEREAAQKAAQKAARQASPRGRIETGEGSGDEEPCAVPPTPSDTSGPLPEGMPLWLALVGLLAIYVLVVWLIRRARR